jgi:hypothetical protein
MTLSFWISAKSLVSASCIWLVTSGISTGQLTNTKAAINCACPGNTPKQPWLPWIATRRRDALLGLTNLGAQRGLIADRRGHEPEQRRDPGAPPD